MSTAAVMYQCFKEMNDHEAETWRFYIPIEGNEDAIETLRCLIDPEAEGNRDACLYDYEFGGICPENEVDILVKHSQGGYMAAHTKLEGKLHVESLLGEAPEDVHSALYKGGLHAFMR